MRTKSCLSAPKVYSQVALFILFILITGSVIANPLPISETIIDEGGEITSYSETPLVLKSENVTFKIDEDIAATGLYTIYNPTDEIINQTILFPIYRNSFYTNWRPGEFYIEQVVIEQKGEVNTSNGYYATKIDGFEGIYQGVLFDISVPPLDEIVVKITWIQRYAITSLTFAKLTYITQTANGWSRPIEYAFFKFIFENITILGEPSGGDRTFFEDGKVVTTIEYIDWSPEADIEITWHPLITYFKYAHSDEYRFYIQVGPIMDEGGKRINKARICMVNEDNEKLWLCNEEGLKTEYIHTDSYGIARCGFLLSKWDYPDLINLSENLDLELVIQKEGYYDRSIDIVPEEKTYIAEDLLLEKRPEEDRGIMPGFTSVSIIIAFIITFIIVREQRAS